MNTNIAVFQLTHLIYKTPGLEIFKIEKRSGKTERGNSMMDRSRRRILPIPVNSISYKLRKYENEGFRCFFSNYVNFPVNILFPIRG